MVRPAPPIAHVVLVAPEIPWNTGNAGRTCLALGAQLHLVGPLGFRLDEKAVRRAGLDYWHRVEPRTSTHWGAFEAEVLPDIGPDKLWLISPDGNRNPWSVDLSTCPVLVFGSEGAGLPSSLRQRFSERSIRIPMQPGSVRSINVSTTVGIILYEVLRQRPTIVDGP